MITLEANYSKKIGLPGYSSHQFSISLKTELPDTTRVEEESARLYRILQDGVDNSIQDIGFLPNDNGHSNGHTPPKANGNGHSNGHSNGYQSGRQVRPGANDAWKFSPKQKELILKIITDYGDRFCALIQKVLMVLYLNLYLPKLKSSFVK